MDRSGAQGRDHLTASSRRDADDVSAPATAGRRPLIEPRTVLHACFATWTVIATLIAVQLPAWEANDEPDHVRNVEVLASGEWYRIEPGSGFEPHQPPAYYVLLAGLEVLTGRPPAVPEPIVRPLDEGPMQGIFLHDHPRDGADQRRVVPFRMVSVALGALTIWLTVFAARTLYDDEWIAVVAGMFVMAVPKFTFVSATVNNDNLAITLGAAGLVATVYGFRATTRRQRLYVTASLGVIAGLLLITKLTAAVIAAAFVIPLVAMNSGWRTRLWGTATVAGIGLALAAPWLVWNQMQYGDPLALKASHDHLAALFPPLFNVAPPLQQMQIVARDFYGSFWYNSGYNQFSWSRSSYHPYWALTILGIFGSLIAIRGPHRSDRLAVTSGLVTFGLAVGSVFVVGLEATTSQGRFALVGLPALAVAISIGYARLRLPIAARLLLPTLGLGGAYFALLHDVIARYS